MQTDNNQTRIFLFPDLAAIRKLLEEGGDGDEMCPSCGMPFDKGKKRKLIDSCGHERCYACMFRNEGCPLCAVADDTKGKAKDKRTNFNFKFSFTYRFYWNLKNNFIFAHVKRKWTCKFVKYIYKILD